MENLTAEQSAAMALRPKFKRGQVVHVGLLEENEAQLAEFGDWGAAFIGKKKEADDIWNKTKKESAEPAYQEGANRTTPTKSMPGQNPRQKSAPGERGNAKPGSKGTLY